MKHVLLHHPRVLEQLPLNQRVTLPDHCRGLAKHRCHCQDGLIKAAKQEINKPQAAVVIDSIMACL